MAELKQRRHELLTDAPWRGAALCGPYSDLVLGELAELWNLTPVGDTAGWALIAVGATARRAMAPGSDVDLLLIHPKKARHDLVERVAQQLWYPLWDADLRVSALVHSVDSIVALAARDMPASTTLLDLALIGGDAQLGDDLAKRAHMQWRGRSRQMLVELRRDQRSRGEQFGDVAFLLEPDLKDGRGGLRDADVLRWAALADDVLTDDMQARRSDIATAQIALLDARVELHRVSRRPANRLLLQEQDAVAAALGERSADDAMRRVSEAGHTIAWHVDRFWSFADRRGRNARRRQPVSMGLAIVDGELRIDEATVPTPALVLHAASAAAINGATLSDQALGVLQGVTGSLAEPWSRQLRQELVTLLGAGDAALGVIEALDHTGLMPLVLAEWVAVRCKPQRNAFHQYTVDRHLCRTAANAAKLVRTVARPDLLLVGAWLHDIGKGFPGDHTEVGEPIVRQVAQRYGFNAADVEVLVALERLHLLLPEVATRRDLGDPGTIEHVARQVGDGGTLDLLHALTIADSLATGPSAWSEWKAALIRDLVAKAHRVLSGKQIPDVDVDVAVRHAALIEQSVTEDGVLVRPIGNDRCVVVAPDRLGLFRRIAGVLSLHSVDVISAEVWTSDDGIAVDEFEVRRRLGGETNWRRVESDLRAVMDGRLDLDARLTDKARSYGRTTRRVLSAEPARTEVIVDNDWSTTATVVEIRAPDGLGLLHRFAACLEDFGLNIRKAKVATLGHEVVDVFYVDRVEDPLRLVGIEQALEAEFSADPS